MSNGSARKRVVLVVLDGWGYRVEREGNAIELAATPVWHRLWDSFPRTLLDASGLAVGLPKGQMGNSEVGHLNLGAGRVVPQDLVRISQSIQSSAFYDSEPLVQLCAELRLTGGYYGMDRDRRWDRTKLAYDAMVYGLGIPVEHPVLAIQAAYQQGETDEFIQPRVHVRNGIPVATMRDGDGVFFFNYRSDRMRQIVAALAIEGFDGFPVRNRPRLSCVTMTQYDQTFTIPQAFPPFSLALILAQVLADHGRTQLRTAENEKYPHGTYFFNGGFEPPYPGEERCLIPSQRVATYDLAPEMSAAGITDALCRTIESGRHDFMLCNFANADMVGHTGVLPAVVQAVETVDRCLARVLVSAEKAGCRVLITADHGNCEMMIDPATGGVHTAHTTNPVPVVAVGTDAAFLRAGGSLRDVAPTVLGLLGLEQPPEMTGRDLRECD